MAFAIHHYEWVRGIHVSFLPCNPSPTSLPLGYHRAPALGALDHIPNSHWLSILHMVMYISMLFSQIIPPSPSPTELKSLS